METRKRFFVFWAVCLMCVNFQLTAFAAPKLIGEKKAKEIALDHTGASADDVTSTKSKLDHDDGVYEYEIKFIWNDIRYEYEIEAVSGQIISYSQKAQNQTRSTANKSKNHIGMDKAKEIALTHAGFLPTEVTFTKTKLDKNDGHAEYEIEFYINKTEYDFEINAFTGKILNYEVKIHKGRI